MGSNCSLESSADAHHHAAGNEDVDDFLFDKARVDEVLRRAGDSAARAMDHWSDFGSAPPHILNDSASPVPTQNPIRARHRSAASSSIDGDMTTTAPPPLQRISSSGGLTTQKHSTSSAVNPMVAHLRHHNHNNNSNHPSSSGKHQPLHYHNASTGTHNSAFPPLPHAVLVPMSAAAVGVSSDATFPSPQLHCRHQQKEDLDGDSDTDHLCSSFLRPSSSSTPLDPISPSRGVGAGVTSSSSSKAEDFDPLSWISDANGKLHVCGPHNSEDYDTVSTDDAFYLLPGGAATTPPRPARKRLFHQHHHHQQQQQLQQLTRSTSTSSVLTLAGRSNGDCAPSDAQSIPVSSSGALDVSASHMYPGTQVALSSASFVTAAPNNDHGQSTTSLASTLSEAAFFNSAQWDSLSRAQRMASTRAMMQKLKEVRQENELVSKGWRRSGRAEGTRSLNGSIHSSEGSISVSFKDHDRVAVDDDDDE
ncbi:Hypothetical protein, putative [Bodo saltans]|uniref:Uncharacterized protein n=1 Tax=Bodo saltans TaxID=75058 RepID=A0A0S4JU72_BODSA|nr:Hypothetical protein, putative [Bodo saltans]|eukprot:CUG92112.1 Hypothetical protein, putative [Bodo saltans]